MTSYVSVVMAALLSITSFLPVHAETAAQDETAVAQLAFSPEYGVTIFPWGAGTTITARDLALAANAGFGWQKALFPWAFIEPHQKEVFQWTEPDRIVRASNAAGLKLIVRVDFQPEWARADRARNGPPDLYQDFGDFIFALADRYRPGSPNGTVHAIQLWNEPNLSREWGDVPLTPDSAWEYTQLLCAGHAAAKAANPSLITISAGLSPNGQVNESARDDNLYLDEMYAAGAAGCFDVLGAHANSAAPSPDLPIGSWQGCDFGESICEHGSFYFRRVEELRSVMVRNGDAAKQMWILEFGWTSDPIHEAYSWHAVTEEQKADNIVNAYRWAYDWWSPWIGVMVLWTFSAPQWTPDQEEYWWAITEPDGTPRLAYNTFAAARASGFLP